MKVINTIPWVFYVNEARKEEIRTDKVGKWMYFFGDRERAESLCAAAVEQGIVAEAKHSNADEGVCCFYLNADDDVTHKKVITFFLENEMIRKTKAGKLYNISFKLDRQTRNGEYGSDFSATIKLAEFVNLATGEWIDKNGKKEVPAV